MFKNLEAEMARKNLTKKKISDELPIVYKTLLNKMNGYTPFTKAEMFAIKKKYFPECTIDYLFAEDS